MASQTRNKGIGGDVTTYPKMNEEIKSLLKLRNDAISLYALARIEELEQNDEELQQQLAIKDKQIELISKRIGNDGKCIDTLCECPHDCGKHWIDYLIQKAEAEIKG